MKRVLFLTALLIAGLGILMSADLIDKRAGGIEVGDKAPDFKLKATDGKTYSLTTIKDAKGEDPKGYVVIFTCNTCPIAKAYEDRIIELDRKFSPKGYPVVAIQPNDTSIKPGDNMEAMTKRAKEKEYSFLYLLDEGQKVYPKYGATRTPEVYLLDSKHILRYTGAIDDNARDGEAVSVKFVEDAIAALEDGNDPDPYFTKAVGCTIKTAK